MRIQTPEKDYVIQFEHDVANNERIGTELPRTTCIIFMGSPGCKARDMEQASLARVTKYHRDSASRIVGNKQAFSKAVKPFSRDIREALWRGYFTYSPKSIPPHG